MTRWLWFVILLIAVMLIQAGLLSNLRIRPDLLLILLVFFAVRSTTFDAVITSFATGLAYDLISNSVMGAGLIAFGIAGTILAYMQRTVLLSSPPFQAFAIFFTGLFAGTIIYLLNALKTGTAGDFTNLAIWTSLYSAVAGPFLFPAVRWLTDFQSNTRRRY
jgi:rod shape-determining protein MreD